MATVDIGASTYSTFADVDFADDYLAADVARSATWATRNADAKGRGMVSAARMLAALPWCDGVPDYDAAPAVVQEVNAMLASDLLTKPKLFADASGNTNVKAVKAGSAGVEFFSPVSGGTPIPKALWDMLNAAGLVCLGSSGTNDGAIVTGISDGCRPLSGRPEWDWFIAAGDYD